MHLRTSLLSCGVALALSVPAAAQQFTEIAPGATAMVTAGVNLRAGPGLEHSRLIVIPEGAAVVIEECVPYWCEVAYDGTEGYVYDTYIVADVTATDEWFLRTSAAHGLRAGPGPEHESVAEIPEGAVLAVQECLPGWCEVTYEGMSGFIEIVAATPEEMSAALSRSAAGAVVLPASGLAVRAGPGTEHNRVSAIPEGASVEMGQCAENWCEVTYGDVTGYAWESYLEPQDSIATASALAPPPAAGERAARATSDLNLRAGAGMWHDPVVVIPAQATVEVGECLPDRVWCEVTYGGTTGYASERYLDFAS